MYCPAYFEESRPEVLLGLIDRYPLATIVSLGASGLAADHVPLMHQPVLGSHGKLIGHVARNNPFWQAEPSREHLIVFQGPSAYISPNWYATKAEHGKVVPTWNYAVVHVHAKLRAIEQAEEIRSILGALTQRHERTQPHPWQPSDAPDDFIEKLVNLVVGIEFAIERIEGKWKVSQNQPMANQQSLVAALDGLTDDASTAMASLVRQFGSGEAN